MSLTKVEGAKKKCRSSKNEGARLAAPAGARESEHNTKSDLCPYKPNSLSKTPERKSQGGFPDGKTPVLPNDHREGIPMPITKSRFFEALQKRPRDMEIYREFLNYYNNQEGTNYTMEEIMDLSAMRMIQDKFQGWVVSCDSPEAAEKMNATMGTMKALYNLILKYRKAADERKPISGNTNTDEMLKKFKKIEEGEYTVLEEEKHDEQGEDDVEDESGVHEGTDDGVTGKDA